MKIFSVVQQHIELDMLSEKWKAKIDSTVKTFFAYGTSVVHEWRPQHQLSCNVVRGSYLCAELVKHRRESMV